MQIHMRFTYSLKEDKEDESEKQEPHGGDDENPKDTRRERQVRRDEERQSIQIKGLQKSQKQKPGSSACSMDKKLPWRKRSEEQRRRERKVRRDEERQSIQIKGLQSHNKGQAAWPAEWTRNCKTHSKVTDWNATWEIATRRTATNI